MMALARFVSVALAALLATGLPGAAAIRLASTALRADEIEAASKNPIRKVVQLLEGMAKKVAEEGEEEEKLYKKFACYCTRGVADLQESISSNDAKVPALQSDIESSESSVAKFKEDVKQHQNDRTSAEKAMQEATAIREKEHAKFQEESGELQGYVDALAKAIPAVTTGMAGTKLLQTGTTAAQLRRAASSDNRLTDDDRDSVISFLSGGADSGSEYVPSSLEVVGILKQMEGDFKKDLATVMSTEEEAAKLYENLMAAKKQEVLSLGASIEKKLARIGDLEIQVVHMKQGLTEAEALLIEDSKFLKDLQGDCGSKQSEWEERKKLRAEELQAIHETIKILNDDDALDLFKKTLPNPSLLQMDAGREHARARAVGLLQSARGAGDGGEERPEVRFLEMALQGKKVDFSKVVTLIDNMVNLLAQEQADDDHKKEYCNKQIDAVEDKAKIVSKSVEDLEASIEDRDELIATLTDDLKALNAEMAELDKMAVEATEQRKEENEDFTRLMSENTEAKELLQYAKNRLNKFYNPNLYKKPAQSEAGDASEAEAEAAPALIQRRAEPGPKPVTWDGYKTKSTGTSNVISMLDLLIRDLTKEMTVAETSEEHSQKEYEGFMQDSASKRAKLVQAVNIKASAKADNEEMKTQEEGDHKSQVQELSAVKQFEHQLHAECDWLLQNFDLRKTARADEVDNLKRAKAVLQGADFSFVQARQQPRQVFLNPTRGA
eukprot:CAMPEP_0170582070 /NCGR_PEP_ID=MMETSP0224-20130122/7382_1 /TAXON_ID=285029 /ORGANISM="Togula jolla, Strain CCCM 725" /LENGTH=723 /DNA_ID=CAMNT_0010905259 /DNA_START=42 /DNA_END=2213 /DNA_ORIENTATION=+